MQTLFCLMLSQRSFEISSLFQNSFFICFSVWWISLLCLPFCYFFLLPHPICYWNPLVYFSLQLQLLFGIFNFLYNFVAVLTVLIRSSSQFGEHLYYHQASLTGRLLISILFSSISKVLACFGWNILSPYFAYFLCLLLYIR